MDSADTDALHQALSAQGKLIHKHEQAITETNQTLQRLIQHINQLGSKMDQLVGQAPHVGVPVTGAQLTPPPDTAVPVMSQPAREPSFPLPERYSGELDHCGRFLFQCSLLFQQQPTTYSGESSRVNLIMSLLTGKAALWAMSLVEQVPTMRNSLADFTDAMRKVFDHPIKRTEAGNRLFSISQYKQTVAEYTVDFRILANESGWGQPALRSAYIRGLDPHIRHQICIQGCVGDLDTIISLAISIDSALREQQRDASRRERPQHRRREVPTNTASGRSPALPPPADEVEPMQLERTRSTTAERNRRYRNYLCFNCGSATHQRPDCPLLNDQTHQQ